MEGGWSDGREDRGSSRSGESSLDDAMLSTLSIRELKRILNENGVDPIKEGKVDGQVMTMWATTCRIS